MAERLFISRHTVESHLKHIYRKLGVTRTELVAEAARRLQPGCPSAHPRLSGSANP